MALAGLFGYLTGIVTEPLNQILRLVGWGSPEPNDADAILSGDYLLDSKEFQIALPPKITKQLKREVIAAESNLDRIKIVAPYCEVEEIFAALESHKHVLTKNLDMASKLIAHADLFTQTSDDKDLSMALRGYNLAMSYLPSDDYLLVEISHQRASVYGWLLDIEGYDKEKKLARSYAVEIGFVGCKDITPRTKTDSDPGQREMTEADEMKIYRDEVIFKVYGAPSAIMPSASEAVLLKYSSDKNERRLEAGVDIEPGTTLIVEDPYVAVAGNYIGFELKFCNNCFKKLGSTVPCQGCVFAVYCSLKCRDEDYESGHRFECPCLGYLFAIKAEPSVRLALRAVCRAGCAKLVDMMNSDSEEMGASGDAHLIPGVDPSTGVYDSNSYHTVTSLRSHVIQDELLPAVCTALMITHILDSQSEFFIDLSDNHLELNKQLFTFVAARILDHMLAFPFNTLSLCRDPKCEESTPKLDLAIGIFPTVSMLNHSCDPNSFWVNLGNGKMSVMTCREVKAGEEFTISYGFNYMQHGLRKRLESSSDRYRFLCRCTACLLKWPTIENLYLGTPQWLCPFCLEYSKDSREQLIKNCTLVPSESHLDQKCKNCDGQFPLKDIFPKYMKFSNALTKVIALVQEGKALEAIPRLKHVIPYFQHNFVPPFIRTILSQELMRNSMDIVVLKAAYAED